MIDRDFIFLAGLHRSGTTLLHAIMRDHSDISGFSETGVPKDEGQFLQTIYKEANVFGGPGKFVFDKRSYMDESHPLATDESSNTIFQKWSEYYDLTCKYLMEKSPPNITKTRFLQKLFPNSKFILILRHPLAVSYATQKWSKTSIKSLLEHSILAYEILFKDLEFIDSAYILRYEEFVRDPQAMIEDIYSYLGLDPIRITRDVRINVNNQYFARWGKDRKNILHRILNRVSPELEDRANQFGYSINNYNELAPVPWLGSHTQSIKIGI